jgi:uncharacterized protein (DUF433 family)
MELEKYFEFINDESIRIAGTRVGIETIVCDYHQGANPEEIVLHYPTLLLEQVHAAITYYLANRGKVESYIEKVKQTQEGAWREQQQHPSEFLRTLRERLEQQRMALRHERAETTSSLSR